VTTTLDDLTRAIIDDYVALYRPAGWGTLPPPPPVAAGPEGSAPGPAGPGVGQPAAVDPRAEQFVAEIVREGRQRGAEIGHFLTGYRRHLSALGVGPDRVREYLEIERRVLGSLYFAVGKPVPSPTTVRALAVRYAADARRAIDPAEMIRFECRRREDGWEIGEYPPYSPVARSLPPPAGFRPVAHPFAELLLEFAFADPPDAAQIVGLVESIYRRAPGPSDTLEAAPERLTFAIDAGRLRLWVDGAEVDGIDGLYEQALLQYLCVNPTARLAGRRLQEQVPELKNASAAAKKVQQAMGRARPEAAAWLLTAPIRWADGISPARRPQGVNTRR
jgi:hypothetical protein